MSGAEHDGDMGEPERVADVKALIREIQRYLSYVDALRKSAQRSAGSRKPDGR